MTCSVGFRAPAAQELARDLLQRLADEDGDEGALYRDPRQPATATPGAIPAALLAFAQAAVARRLADPQALARALGESLTEPKPRVWFERQAPDRWRRRRAAGRAQPHAVRRAPRLPQRRGLTPPAAATRG